MKRYFLTTALLMCISGCAKKSIENNGISLISGKSVPAQCQIIDSFTVYAQSKIVSFYELTNKDLSNPINSLIFSDDEHHKFEREAWDKKLKEAEADYFKANPDQTSLPLDYCCIPIGHKSGDKSLKGFKGVLLNCSYG